MTMIRRFLSSVSATAFTAGGFTVLILLLGGNNDGRITLQTSFADAQQYQHQNRLQVFPSRRNQQKRRRRRRTQQQQRQLQTELPDFPDFSLETLDIKIEKGEYTPIEFNATGTVGTTEFFVVTKSHGNPEPGRIWKPSSMRGGGWEQVIYAGDDDKAVEIWYRQITSDEMVTANDNGEFDAKGAPSISIVRLIFNEYLWIGGTEGKGMPYGECVEIYNDITTQWRPSQNDTGGTYETISPSPSDTFLVVFGSDNRGTSEYVDYDTSITVKSINERTDDPSFYYIASDPYLFDYIQTCDRRGALASVQLLLQDPTATPSMEPSTENEFRALVPTESPTNQPTGEPSSKPTDAPTAPPTELPTGQPSSKPTSVPTSDPTSAPTSKPSFQPSSKATSAPTSKPTSDPTSNPSSSPTSKPTSDPTSNPSSSPTSKPTSDPTSNPSSSPTSKPTSDPTLNPSSSPSSKPTFDPTASPTRKITTNPTFNPTDEPTTPPTRKPTKNPSSNPTDTPTGTPTQDPTQDLTQEPTPKPTPEPTIKKVTSRSPTSKPTREEKEHKDELAEDDKNPTSFKFVQRSACGYWDIQKNNNGEDLSLQSCFIKNSVYGDFTLEKCQAICSTEPYCYAIAIHRTSEQACFIYVNAIPEAAVQKNMICSTGFGTNQKNVEDREESSSSEFVPLVLNCRMIGPSIHDSYDCYYDTYASYTPDDPDTSCPN